MKLNGAVIPDEIVRRVSGACDEVDSGAGLLILADVHGSSPFRACQTAFPERSKMSHH